MEGRQAHTVPCETYAETESVGERIGRVRKED